MSVRTIGPDQVTRVKRDLNRLIPEHKGTFTVSKGMGGIYNWGVLVTADGEGAMWYVKQVLRTRGYWFVDSPTNGCAVWIEKQEPPKRDRTDIPDGAHMTTHGNAPHISSILKANSSAARVRKYGAHGVLIEHPDTTPLAQAVNILRERGYGCRKIDANRVDVAYYRKPPQR